MRFFISLTLFCLAGCTDDTTPLSQQTEVNSTQLHPDYPIVQGHYQMTKSWSVVLPSGFNRRFEDGDLVIWKPGFTIWATVWNNDKSETQDERLAWITEDSSSDAFDVVNESSDGILRYAYRLKENSEDDRQPGFYCFAIGRDGHVQMAIYFDSANGLADALAIWRSLTELQEIENKAE